MNIAYLCVLLAILLPYVWAMYAKLPYFRAGNYDNNNPRPLLEKLAGPYQRSNWAQQNAFEALPGFIGGVAIASIAGVAQPTLDTLAVVFILARVAHGICYIKDLATLRSIVWAIGLACVIALLIAAIL